MVAPTSPPLQSPSRFEPDFKKWRGTPRPRVGCALRQLGIEHVAACSPEARRRSEGMVATLQKRLPQELRLAGITREAA